MTYNVSYAERVLKNQTHESFSAKERHGALNSIIDFFWNDGGDSSNDRVWPVSLLNTFSHIMDYVCSYLFLSFWFECRR